MGFYLPDFAKEMKAHALTAQLIGYFPRLRTNERVYLTDGKNEVYGHLDFTSAEGAESLGVAACWQLKPVTAEDDGYLYFTPEAIYTDASGVTKGYAAVYTDFPMKAVDPQITKLYTLSAETKEVIYNTQPYPYYEVEEMQVVPARTPVLVEMMGDNPKQNRILPDFTTVMPEPVPDGFTVGDDVITDQRAPRRANEDKTVPYFHGVLLPTTVHPDSFYNQWGLTYDHDNAPVHTLTNRRTNLWMKQADLNSTLRANQAFLLKEPTIHGGYAIFKPTEDVVVGINAIEGTQDGPVVIYDLNGRQVSEMQSGQIYILNGKKIIAL